MLPFAAGSQRQSEKSPALGASWSLKPSHGLVFRQIGGLSIPKETQRGEKPSQEASNFSSGPASKDQGGSLVHASLLFGRDSIRMPYDHRPPPAVTATTTVSMAALNLDCPSSDNLRLMAA